MGIDQASSELTPAARDLVHQWMVNHGTVDRAEKLVQKWVNEADQILNDSTFADTSMLSALADLILKRQN